MAQKTSNARQWVRFDPTTATYVTGDDTRVAAELVENQQSLLNVLHIAQIRETQRSARRATKGERHELPTQ